MKLRNKKTGEVVEGFVQVVAQNNDKFPNPLEFHTLTTIAECNEEWEDAKEPLIKDEKVRKAVRAWAEAEGIESVAVMCHLAWGEKMTEIAKISNAKQKITFKGDLGIKMGDYTVTELCGEEEE